jgi:uncharacterized protein (TIGR03118 family)
MNRQQVRCGRLAAVLSFAIFSVMGCGSGGGNSNTQTPRFQQTNLVSDQAGVAPMQDTNLVNPWGLAVNPTGNFWISDNGTGLSSVYSGDVNGSALVRNSLVVTVPGDVVTGQVYNGTTDFMVTNGVSSGPALFIFSSESGRITGWNPTVSPITSAQNGATVAGAVYKGLAIGNVSFANYLYAPNFSAGTIDVFNSNFIKVTLTGTFTDPTLPAGFAPFNIQNLNGKLYVTYAKQDAAHEGDVAGPGNGYVSVFDMNGNFIKRLVSGGNLNSPWGLAIAPSTWGQYAGSLIVGNFGDGHINVYNSSTGAFIGQAMNAAGNPITIDGLWALAPGNGSVSGDLNALYFTAGTYGETHGLFGKLTLAP